MYAFTIWHRARGLISTLASGQNLFVSVLKYEDLPSVLKNHLLIALYRDTPHEDGNEYVRHRSVHLTRSRRRREFIVHYYCVERHSQSGKAPFVRSVVPHGLDPTPAVPRLDHGCLLTHAALKPLSGNSTRNVLAVHRKLWSHLSVTIQFRIHPVYVCRDFSHRRRLLFRIHACR